MGVDGGGREGSFQAIGAGAVQPVDGDAGLALPEGNDGGSAVDFDDGGFERDRSAEIEAGDVQGVDVDAHGQAEATLRRFCLGGGRRGQARHGDASGLEKLDIGGAADESERRPMERKVVDGEPRAVRVAQFSVGEAQRIGKTAGKSGENNGAAGQVFCFGFDQALAGAGVCGDQDQGDKRDWQQDDREEEAFHGHGPGKARMFFSEEKNQKTFKSELYPYTGFGRRGGGCAELKVFCFFSSEKKCFFSCLAFFKMPLPAPDKAQNCRHAQWG
jgi:hypothetical protein